MPLILQISSGILIGIAGLAILVLSVRWLRAGSISKRLVQYVSVPMDTTRSQVNASLRQPRLIT